MRVMNSPRAVFFAIAPVLLAASFAAAVPPDRGDLAAAYQRFDHVASTTPKDPATREMLSRGFDGLTAEFFSGRFGAALQRLASIESSLRQYGDDEQAEMRALAGQRFVVSPRTVVVGKPSTLTLRVDELDGVAPGSSPVSIVVTAGDMRVEVPFAHDQTIELPAIAKSGPVQVWAAYGIIGDHKVARVFALDEPLADTQAKFDARIKALEANGTLGASDLASLKARAALLSPDMDRTRSVTLLADLSALSVAIARELDLAEAGKSPYAVRGELWRMYRVLGTELPVRQYVPEGDGPFPLVIAFHGAGADENMFFDGYGEGALLKLAKSRRVAVVCPPTVPFGVSPNVLDRFLDEVAKSIPFDRSRVLLVGHSMGAITASRLAALKPTLVAGAACIAGFSEPERHAEQLPPRRVFLAELDPLFPLEQTRATVEAAQRQGGSIELTVVPHEGHTLVVDRVLPQAIDWLLARPARTTATTKPTASTPSTSPMKTGSPAPAEKDASPSAGPRQ